MDAIDFSAIADRLPPQNIEAEEAILGGITLDPQAIERIVDSLEPEAFYLSAHKDIYQAILALHNQDKPVDLLSVTNWLSDLDLLKRIGGKSKLAQLVDRTVSAVNIDAMAALVQNKYLSRRLIWAGTEINKMGYEEFTHISDRLDNAEAKLFAINHKVHTSSDLELVGDFCVDVFSETEEASTGSIPSIRTGFYDLDDLLGGGLYPGSLIVVAGRPSMGKSAFSHYLALKIARLYQSPAAIFSLEMDKKEILRRFLASISEIDSTRIRQGKLQTEEWTTLAEAIALVSETKVLIDDSSCPSPHEIRSKVRRAITKHGQLKLVIKATLKTPVF